eukprot:647403-Rhodomonas_salina.1
MRQQRLPPSRAPLSLLPPLVSRRLSRLRRLSPRMSRTSGASPLSLSLPLSLAPLAQRERETPEIEHPPPPPLLPPARPLSRPSLLCRSGSGAQRRSQPT